MKKYLLIGSLLATVILAIPFHTWSRVDAIKNVHSGIPKNVLETANDWMAAHALPYTRIRPTYTRLGKGLWEIGFTWQVASGAIYDATLVISPAGEILNDPIIEELPSWPY